MNLERIMAISGMAGLYKMITNKSNGLIVANFDTGKKRFISARKHQFTPLETISIYTDDGDSVPLTKVFQSMIDQKEDNPPIKTSASGEDITEYFTDILPNYDKDKVYLSDMKKVVKWFKFIEERDIFNMPSEELEEEEKENKEEA